MLTTVDRGSASTVTRKCLLIFECVCVVDRRPGELLFACYQSNEQVLLRMSNPFGYAPADSEVGSKYGNTSGTHMETIYPVTEMLHGEARDLRWAPTAVVR
jgi:hypothetical protein